MLRFCAAFLLLCYWVSAGLAQNLVPNGSFEQAIGLPSWPGEWYRVIGWSNVNGHRGFHTLYGSPDFLHKRGTEYASTQNRFAFGEIAPYEGEALMGLLLWSRTQPDFREYLMVQLTEPLQIGHEYEISVMITNGATSGTVGGYASDGLQVCLSEAPLQQAGHEPIDAQPQGGLSELAYPSDWKRLSFRLVARQPFAYLTLGNFRSDSLTEVRMIADLVNPSAYLFVDAVSVISLGELPVVLDLPNVFTPNQDGYHDRFVPMRQAQIASIHLSIHDRWGRQVHTSHSLFPGWDGSLPNGQSAPAGVYYFQIKARDYLGRPLLRKGALTLLR